MANRLQHASSPYLRQHADNPVEWWEWGDDAFAAARERDVPLFLSVGYASCHWCHVMAHESFEDLEIAARLNVGFVPVKVDREERPDVDAVYMDAVQALTGHGGWPMSVFLTPDGEPFFGGTYWPRDDRSGMPGFLKVLDAVRGAWADQREQVVGSGRALAERLREQQAAATARGADGVPADAALAAAAAATCVSAWDRESGGFGRAPKFPQAMTIDFLLAHGLRTGDGAATAAAVGSLEAMALGGIHDQVGGGFHRYATDPAWLVPHFEKMLYDNALLLRAYVHAWQVTGRPRFRRVAATTAAYLVRELQQPGGGFSSSTDADSEGGEGRFFVWTDDEYRSVVRAAGEDPDRAAAVHGVMPGGNWEGVTIPTLADPSAEEDPTELAALDRVRAALYEHRSHRPAPATDDKVLTAWNGLAIGALAEAGAVLGEPAFVEAAVRCARFVRDALVVDGRLHRTWRDGHGASVPAFCEDVAALAQGLLVLAEVDPDPAWPAWAAALADDAEARFADPGTGTYFATAHDAETLVSRPKDLWDNAVPAAPSVLADVHLRLAGLSGDLDHRDLAARTLAAFAPGVARAPTGYGELLRSLERALAGPREVAVVGPSEDPATRALVGVYREAWRPGAVLAVGVPGTPPAVPLLADRPLVDGQPAAYVCRDLACDRPVTTPAHLRTALTH